MAEPHDAAFHNVIAMFPQHAESVAALKCVRGRKQSAV